MLPLAQIKTETKELHNITENLAYLARYNTNNLTLIDHYRHLCQLKPIYAFLEAVLTKSTLIPDEFAELLQRSKLLQADISYLSQFIPSHLRNVSILPTTERYIGELKNLINLKYTHEDGCSPFAAEEVCYPHFLTRILGDLHGGQAVKGYVAALYARANIQRENADDGLSFHHFSPGMLLKFARWLNESKLPDNTTAEMNNSFQHHINIFTELENTRVKQAPVNNVGIFAKLWSKEGAMAVGAVAAGLVLTRMIL